MTGEPPAPTYAACLTPAGTGAIATLGLHGPRAWALIRKLFIPTGAPGRQLPAEPTQDRFWYGRLGEDPLGPTADDVVVGVRSSGRGSRVEIHCHGGCEVVRYLLELLEGQGVRICSWQELERRHGENPGQAAALAALVEARTVRTAGILLDQYHGAMTRAVDAVLTALHGGRVEEARAGLRELLKFAPVGRRLTTPWRVVVAGAPNVGKSSLVNALAGYQRSLVAATPGTTRDVVTTLIAVDGWLVELADTAGLRPQAAGLERLGMERAEQVTRSADLVLWVIDHAAPAGEPPGTSVALQWIVNKIDLPAAGGFKLPAGAVTVSARTGAGLDELCRALARWLVPAPPPPGAAVPFTADLCKRLAAAYAKCLSEQTDCALGILETIWE
jgi:tRNA modification GTPase